MNVLVAGGSGFIGRAVTAHLAGTGRQVTATYRSDETFPDFARQVGATPIRMDLRDAEAARKVPDADVCVFAAGTSDHAISAAAGATEPQALVNLLDGFRGRLVLVSSGAVYFGHKGVVAEDAPLVDAFPYSLAKSTCEQHVLRAAASGRLEGASILRVFYAFGPGERATRLIPRVREAVRAGARTFTVRGDGDSIIDPLPVGDIARAVGAAALGRACDGGVFNVSSGAPLRVKDLVRTVAEVAGRPVEVACDGAPEAYPVRFWGDPSLFRKTTGFTPTPFVDALRAYAHTASEGA